MRISTVGVSFAPGGFTGCLSALRGEFHSSRHVVVVDHVQYLAILSRHKLEVLSLPIGLQQNTTAHDFVFAVGQDTCIPEEYVVNISYALPGRPFSTVPIRGVELSQDVHHDFFSPLPGVWATVADVKDLADAERMHRLVVADLCNQLD